MLLNVDTMRTRNGTKIDAAVTPGLKNIRVNGGGNGSRNNANNKSNCISAAPEIVRQANRDTARYSGGSRPLRNHRVEGASSSLVHSSTERIGGVSRSPTNPFASTADASQGHDINRGTEYPPNANANNIRDWRQLKFVPRLNGPQNRSSHYDNRDKRWQQQYRNNSPCRRSYHSNNLKNTPNKYRQSPNYNSNRNWQSDRYYSKNNNLRQTQGDNRARISEAINQNCVNDHRSTSKSNSEKRTSELGDKGGKQKAHPEVKRNPSDSADTTAKSRRKSQQNCTLNTTSKESTEDDNAQNRNCIKALFQNNDNQYANQKSVENQSELSAKSIDKADSDRTYPKIQVRPLTELLQEKNTETVKKPELSIEKSASPATKLGPRPALRIPRRSTISNCRDNVVSFSDRLAGMDKEALKYIINNSDTIFEEQLQIQARQRICEQITRRLKGIELEKPKDSPATELVEDDIVDAAKLPDLFLQEIEKRFGIDIIVNKKDQNHIEKTTNQMNADIVLSAIVKVEDSSSVDKEAKRSDLEAKTSPEVAEETDISTECTDKDKTNAQVLDVVNKQVQPTTIKRKSSKERQQGDASPKRDKVSEASSKEESPPKRNKQSEVSSKEGHHFEAPTKRNKQTTKAKKPITENLSESMAKRGSSDLMPRLNVVEEFQSGTEDKFNSFPHRNGHKVDKKTSQKDSRNEKPVDTSLDLEEVEVEIKKEPMFCSTSPVPTFVISSSEDDDSEGDDDNEDELPNTNGNVSDDSNTSNSSISFKKHQCNQKMQSDVVLDTFDKLILPHLEQQLVERYRDKHCGTLNSRLQFILCVVTSSEHNPEAFSNAEISKIQKNLKESNNRSAIEFLLKQIVNVVAAQRSKELEEQRVPNEIIRTKSAESAEVPHQRNHQELSPPPLPCQSAPISMPCVRQQTYNLASNMQLQLGVDSTMPRLPPNNCYPLLASGETANESSYGQLSESVTQSLLEIDRRLLEYQNRRSFLDEIIMKFQKEKSDLEMLTFEMHSRKFLILNTVLSKNQSGSTPARSTGSPRVTPTISPMLDTEPISREVILPFPPAVTTTSKERPRSDSVHLTKAKKSTRRKLRSNKEPNQQDTESICIPKPMSVKIKEDPDMEIEETSLAVTVPAKKLCVAKSNPTQQQQPLAIIPPLPPPPPPPEPIVNMSYVSPQPLPNRAQVDVSIADFASVPNGRLHSISYPITQILIFKMYIIASSEDGDIYMFNILNHKLERQITKHSEAITNMYLCEKDSYLYTTSLDGFLKKTSLENLERVMQTVYVKEPLQSIDVAWGTAFIGSRWGNLFTFDVMTNKVMDPPLLSTGQSIIAVKATKEGPRKIVVLGCKGNFVYMHDATTGLLLRRLTLPNDLNVYSLLLNDGHVYCGTQKNEIYKFDFASGSLVDKASCGNGAVSIVAYGDQYLLAGCYDGFIYVLDKLRCRQLGRFEGAGRMVLALAIAGNKIVTSSKDKSLVVLEIPQQIINTEEQ